MYGSRYGETYVFAHGGLCGHPSLTDYAVEGPVNARLGTAERVAYRVGVLDGALSTETLW